MLWGMVPKIPSRDSQGVDLEVCQRYISYLDKEKADRYIQKK
jgi:hypothetical protein